MTYTFGVKITGTAGLLQSVVEESDREIAANLAKRVAVADNGATASDGSGGPSESSGATHTWLKALEGGNKEILSMVTILVLSPLLCEGMWDIGGP